MGRNISKVDGQSMSERQITRRELFRMVVPRGVFPTKGDLVLDPIKCTACALCAQECPTGALTVDGTESVSFVFCEDLCDSCGLCIKICPEQCLKLERGTGKSGTVVLLEDEFARCTNCGAVIGSRAMIRQISSKLSKTDFTITSELQLCPECKVRVSLRASKRVSQIIDEDGDRG
jgi:ferredoxin